MESTFTTFNSGFMRAWHDYQFTHTDRIIETPLNRGQQPKAFAAEGRIDSKIHE